LLRRSTGEIMNLQEELIHASADLRARAMSRVDGVKKLLVVLNAARLEFRKVTREHAGRFVKQNSPLFAAVRQDVSELARSTYRTLKTGAAPKARRARAKRKSTRKAA
jgi:hypothetical protein